jgi:hypothetical protein
MSTPVLRDRAEWARGSVSHIFPLPGCSMFRKKIPLGLPAQSRRIDGYGQLRSALSLVGDNDWRAEQS